MDNLTLLLLIPTFFHVIFLMTAIINAIAGPFLNKIEFHLKDYPLVSVLIPARNEERNIAACLDSMLAQDYPNYEILVLDDNSEDSTSEIIAEYAEKHDKIKAYRGGELLPGWTGKNNACRQLVEKANGAIFVFTDADNTYGSSAIKNSIKFMSKYELDFMSSFPQQITKSISEKIIIPFLDLVIYSFFILWSQYYIKWNIFAAANGQWIVCKKTSYLEIGGHAKVKGRIVEDVSLFREAKRRNMKTLTLAGTGIIYGRMYTSYKEIWHGLSKNIFGIADYNTMLFMCINIVLFVFIISPYCIILYSNSLFVIIVNFIILLLWKVTLALNFKHNIFISVFMHPIMIFIINALSLNSIYRNKFGDVQWKGRKMKVRDREVQDIYEK